MIIDLSKYNSYIKEYKELDGKIAANLEEPYVTFTDKPYSYVIEGIDLFFMEMSKWRITRLDPNVVLPYYKLSKIATPFLIDFPDIYQPYNGPGKTDLDYDYYSRGYIPPLEFIINDMKLKPDIIKGYIDTLGRLHIISGISNYVYALENKIPKISIYLDILDFGAPVLNSMQSNITPENQISLCKNYLEPIILMNSSLKDINYLELITRKDTICYKLLESISWEVLQYFIKNFLTLEEVLTYRELGDFTKSNGFIFPDGSFLFFRSMQMYHNFFLRCLCRKPINYHEDQGWVKLNCFEVKDTVIAMYSSKKITPEARRYLNIIKRKFYVEEFDIDIKDF